MIGIFIPYRNRKEHLDILLDNLSKYNTINIHILEQDNNNLFCRGKLFNIGIKEFINKYDYFIFHDVDLIPQNENYLELFKKFIDKKGNKIIYIFFIRKIVHFMNFF